VKRSAIARLDCDVPVSRGRESYVDSSLLSVQLKRRADSTVIWEGRASTFTDAGSPADSPAALSQKLATDMSEPVKKHFATVLHQAG